MPAHGCARAPPPWLGSGGASQQEGSLVAGMQMSWGSKHGREEQRSAWGPGAPLTPQETQTKMAAQAPGPSASPCPLAGVSLALERCLRYVWGEGRWRQGSSHTRMWNGTWEKVVPVPGWATAPRPASTPPLQPPPQPLVIT